MNNNQCNKVNCVWEDKGIILGIIYYISKHEPSIDDTYIIKNKKYRNILRKLFFNYKFKKHGEGYVINIKNNVRNDLIINNINNLTEINAKYIYLLPWFDNENPIIMYKFNKNKNINVDDLKKEIKEFSRCDRGKKYTHSIINNIWDSYTEYTILQHYIVSNKNNSFRNIEELYDFISTNLITSICYQNNMLIPYFIEKQINYPVPYFVPCKNKEFVKNDIIIKTDCKNIENQYIDFIKNIEQSLEKTNKLIYKNLK